MPNCQIETKQISVFESPLIPWKLGDDYSAVLSADERARASRYRFASRRHAFIASRMLLRTALGGHLGIPPEEIQISLDAEGKPQLRHAEEMPARFNISHTEDFVIVGLTEFGAIGVDVEELRRPLNVEILLKNYFSSTEYSECLRYPAEQRKAAFLRGWTRKEAAWKYFGGESKMPWQHIAVSFDDDSSTHIRLTGDSAAGGMLLDSFTWQPTATCIASAVFRAPATTRPQHISQTNNIFGFGGVRQLIWNLETSLCED